MTKWTVWMPRLPIIAMVFAAVGSALSYDDSVEVWAEERCTGFHRSCGAKSFEGLRSGLYDPTPVAIACGALLVFAIVVAWTGRRRLALAWFACVAGLLVIVTVPAIADAANSSHLAYEIHTVDRISARVMWACFGIAGMLAMAVPAIALHTRHGATLRR